MKLNSSTFKYCYGSNAFVSRPLKDVKYVSLFTANLWHFLFATSQPCCLQRLYKSCEKEKRHTFLYDDRMKSILFYGGRRLGTDTLIRQQYFNVELLSFMN